MTRKYIAFILTVFVFIFAACGNGDEVDDSGTNIDLPPDEQTEIPPEDEETGDTGTEDPAEPENTPEEIAPPEEPEIDGTLLTEEDGYRLYEDSVHIYAEDIVAALDGKTYSSIVTMTASPEEDAEEITESILIKCLATGDDTVEFSRSVFTVSSEGLTETAAYYKDGFYYQNGYMMQDIKVKRELDFSTDFFGENIEPYAFPREAVAAADVYDTGDGYVILFRLDAGIIQSSVYSTQASSFLSTFTFDTNAIAYIAYLDGDKAFAGSELIFNGMGYTDGSSSPLYFEVVTAVHPLEGGISYPEDLKEYAGIG